MTFDDEKKIKDEKNELKDIRRVRGARYQCQSRVYRICARACDLRAHLNYLISSFIEAMALRRPRASASKNR